jgi:hypothetical protein
LPSLCGLVLCAADYPPPPAQLKPYIKDGRLDPGDYAMLKLTGKQRYGTQFHCVDGRRMPQPLEDDLAVDRLRREAGIETLAEYAANMGRLFGTR